MVKCTYHPPHQRDDQLTSTGLLCIVLTNFQCSLTEFNTKTVGMEGPVNQVEWHGNDPILIIWDNLALLVGPSGNTL